MAQPVQLDCQKNPNSGFNQDLNRLISPQKPGEQEQLDLESSQNGLTQELTNETTQDKGTPANARAPEAADETMKDEAQKGAQDGSKEDGQCTD
jgi:hypothetical protein